MKMHGTTILAVKKDGMVAMAGDGQVTFGETAMKGNARKVRTTAEGRVVVGFAGATADAFTLLEHFEGQLKTYDNDIARASVELAKQWRMDKLLRRLEAMLLVADAHRIFLVSGTGDVVEPEKGAIGIGSGGNYAYAAALAYLENPALSAREVAQKSLEIAAGICIYTNNNIIVEEVK
ncbi:MAG: ATP-dependent protease subunit HslV [Spirochaetales bacterium]|jgi:ATP-dependent HslUV protease subunit HslV|nr:ATP-dependent protease subunit HslV [Spirochaetales bacterium]